MQDRALFVGIVTAELVFWWWAIGLATGLVAAAILLCLCRPTP